jgi:hypothetical protein
MCDCEPMLPSDANRKQSNIFAFRTMTFGRVKLPTLKMTTELYSYCTQYTLRSFSCGPVAKRVKCGP